MFFRKGKRKGDRDCWCPKPAPSLPKRKKEVVIVDKNIETRIHKKERLDLISVIGSTFFLVCER